MYLTITLCAQLEPDIASKRYHAVWTRTFFFTCWSALTLTFNPERLMQCYFKLFNQTHSMDETWARLGGVKLFFRQNMIRTNWQSSVTINFLFARTVLYAYCLFTYLELEVSLCISQHVTFLDILTVVCRIF